VSDPLLDLVTRGVRVFDLGRPMFAGMPQSPNHPRFLHSVTRRHGDVVRADGGSAANDLLVTGTHVGTHIDALAHVSHQGLLHGGAEAAAAMEGGRFMEHGVHTIAPIVGRGVLLDIPATLGTDSCLAGQEITAADLAATAGRQGTSIGAGDVVLVRSGWGRRFDQGAESYLGFDTGVPGVGEEGACWLADHGVLAAGADTVAFERLAPGEGHALLPAHRVLLVEYGVYIVEALNLEELALAGQHEFTIIISPLNVVGATGSPVRPLAVASNGASIGVSDGSGAGAGVGGGHG
jgi:kynurenine formamidase